MQWLKRNCHNSITAAHNQQPILTDIYNMSNISYQLYLVNSDRDCKLLRDIYIT